LKSTPGLFYYCGVTATHVIEMVEIRIGNVNHLRKSETLYYSCTPTA